MALEREEAANRDVIRQADFFRMIWRCRLLVLGLTVGIAAVGYGASYLRPQLWEAKGVVRIGQLGGDKTRLIEPVQDLLERVKFLTFSGALARGLPTSASECGNTYQSTFKAKQLLGTELVELSVRGCSPDQAKQFIAVTADQIIKIHDQEYLPQLQRIRERIELLKRQIEEARTSKVRLTALAAPMAGERNTAVFGEKWLSGMVRSQIETELGGLERTYLSYVEQLQTSRPTVLIQGIGVSDHPVAPRRGLAALMAAIVGFMIGVGICFARAKLELQPTAAP